MLKGGQPVEWVIVVRRRDYRSPPISVIRVTQQPPSTPRRFPTKDRRSTPTASRERKSPRAIFPAEAPPRRGAVLGGGGGGSELVRP